MSTAAGLPESNALRESEERLQLALRAGGSGVWDWDMARDVAEVSPSYRELFGLPPDKPVDYETWLACVHPEDRQRCREYGEKFFQSTQTEWRLDFRIVTPQQGVRFHQAIGRVYRDARGKPLRFVGVSTDVTEKQRTVEALRESEERFRAMADGLPLMIWVHGPQGEQQFVNATFLEYFGVTHEEMRGGRWQLLLHPEDAAAYTEEFLACVRERRPFHAEARVRDAHGEWRTIESWGRPRFSVSGEFLGFVGTSADITERKRFEQALREADRRKDEFLAILGHELRNPLAAMSAAMELFRRMLPPEPRLQELRETMERQIALFTRLVDDLLDSARISTGKIELRRGPVSLHHVVSAAAEISQPLMVARGHQLVLEQPGERVIVDGDELRLVQIVSNLLNNAARYTPGGGRIVLALERSGEEALVRVRDNGIGIAPELLQRVFDIFVQAGQAAGAPGGRGLGVGLTLVRRLAELHGGSVEAKSEGAGRGSEFLVRLPLARHEELPAGAGLEDRSAARRSRRILVVDDNRDACSLLCQLLELLGHEVCQAHDGASALEAARAFRPDVALLDIGLPDMDGYAVAAELRRAAGTRHVTLVTMSGYGAEHAARSRSAGIEHHLIKPIDAARLEALLR